MSATSITTCAADGMPLRGYRWHAACKAPRELVIVHGGFEHIARYSRLAGHFSACGFNVTGLDLRGHGHSGGRRGHIHSFSDYALDLKAAVGLASEQPVILLGHSMGALIVLDALCAGLTGVERIVLTSPFLGLPQVPAWKHCLVRMLSPLLPTFRLPGGLKPRDICSDPAVVRAYAEDPLIYSTLTAHCAAEMIRAHRRVHAAAATLTHPAYLAYGSQDRVVSICAIEDFASRYGGPLTTRLWEGLFHELLNETIRDQVIGEIGAWLQGTVS